MEAEETSVSEDQNSTTDDEDVTPVAPIDVAFELYYPSLDQTVRVG